MYALTETLEAIKLSLLYNKHDRLQILMRRYNLEGTHSICQQAGLLAEHALTHCPYCGDCDSDKTCPCQRDE